MQVVYHIGAPGTDDDLLLGSLLKNRAALARQNIIVPPPTRYRTVVRDTGNALEGRPANDEVQAALIDAIVDEHRIDRLILSDPRFICINRLVVQGPQIWPMIDRKAAQLRGLFPSAEVEFFIGMRDPATLIPELWKTSKISDFEEFTANMQPHAVAWSEMLRRLRNALPGCPVTVWCNEDTPLLWGEILREMAAIGADMPLDGQDDLVETIMDPEGFDRLKAYLRDTPPETEMQRRRIVAAFLDRYAREDAIEEELDLPGWTEELMADLTESYENDMEVIARLPGVTLLAP